MKRFKFDWLVYFLASLVFITLGIILIVNDYEIGLKILNIALAILLVLYLALYLFQILKQKRGTVQILVIIEFVLVALIAVGLVLQQFKVFNIAEACQVAGIVIWLRSAVELYRGYVYRGNASNFKYPVWYFCLFIALITLGTYMFAKPFFNNTQVVLVLSILCFVLSLVLIILGIIYVPKKTDKKKKK